MKTTQEIISKIDQMVEENEQLKYHCINTKDLHNALGYGKVVIELLTLKQFIIEPKNEQLNDLFEQFGRDLQNFK
jgi:hypothetical protein